jgi:hypothetical protein
LPVAATIAVVNSGSIPPKMPAPIWQGSESDV